MQTGSVQPVETQIQSSIERQWINAARKAAHMERKKRRSTQPQALAMIRNMLCKLTVNKELCENMRKLA